jgi:hypothetical protein
MPEESEAFTSARREPRKLAPNAVHLVRTSVLANLKLSQMADQKASILMGATFLVFTLSVGQIGSGAMAIPLVILALFAFASAVLSVLAVLPKITHGSPRHEKDNILFFGVFSQMSEDDFANEVIDHLETDEAMYRLMLRDVYQNGLVLQRKKYRFLALAYRTFLLGLVLALTAFLVVTLTELGG